MKTSTTSSSSKLLALVLALAPALAEAKLAAKVHALKGGAFTVMNGVTTALKADMDLEEGADVLVSDDAAVTIGDFYDRRHHLSAGSHATVADGQLILKKGAVWTQSRGAKRPGTITTGNLLVQGFLGEWIVTFDVASGRTQVTTISGEVDVASPEAPAFKYAVAAGYFTFAEPKSEGGYPRSPTKLGYDSLMQTLALFPGQRSMDAGIAKAQEEAGKRAPASMESTPTEAVGHGKVLHIRTVESGDAQKYFLKSLPRAHKRSGVSGQRVPIRIFGLQAVKAQTARKPAAVSPKLPKASVHRGNNEDFLKSYEQHQREQPKNPQEVQRLIDDLQSFN